MATNPSDQFWYLNADGIDLELYIKAIVSGGDWELLGATVNGIMTVSRHTE
jgi:hypothetical protein